MSPAFNSYAMEDTQPIMEQSVINETVINKPLEQPSNGISSLLEAIRKRRKDSHIIDDSNKEVKIIQESVTRTLEGKADITEVSTSVNNTTESMLQPFIKELSNTPIQKTKSGMLELLDEINSNKEIKAELPQIKVDEETQSLDSSNSSMNQLFPEPKVTETEVKSGFNTLFDQIRSSPKESGTPNITQIGLNPGTPQLSSQPLSPLRAKPSLGDLFEDTANLFIFFYFKIKGENKFIILTNFLLKFSFF